MRERLGPSPSNEAGRSAARRASHGARRHDRAFESGGVFDLHESIGNRAVGHHLQRSAWPAHNAPAPCKCGGTCPACRAARALRVSRPGDAHEADASRRAAHVMQATPDVNRTRGVPRASAIASAETLSDADRAFFESRFGADLSQVRIHRDARASALSAHFGARAFTYGRDIYFADGMFRPDTDGGRSLLAHEIAHVVQGPAPETVHRDPDPKYAQFEHQPGEGMGESYGGYDFSDNFPNAALDAGVPKEYWDPAIERTYWRIGEHKAAHGMRDCRRNGRLACTKLLSQADVNYWYAYGSPHAAWRCPGSDDPRPPSAASAQSAETRSKGETSTAIALGMLTPFAPTLPGIGPTPVPPAPPPGLPPPTLPPTTGFPSWSPPPPVVTPGPTPTPTPTPYGATAVGPAFAVMYVVAAAAALTDFGSFQDSLVELGYTILPEQFAACITGCHPNVPNATPREFQRGQPDFSHPRQWDFPSPRITPDQWPNVPRIPKEWLAPRKDTGTDLWPSPDTDTDKDEEERRRPRPRIRLELPRAKGRYLDRYESAVAQRQLVHNPGYGREDPYDPRQAAVWRRELDPDGPAGVDRRLFRQGVMALQQKQGKTEDEARRLLLIPSWSRSSPNVDMTVDHVVELQVTAPQDRAYWSNTIFNFALLDGSTNSSVGSRLAQNIQRERLRLLGETWDFRYLFAQITFDVVVMDGYGSEGQHWTIHEIRRGDHIRVLLDRLGF